MTVLLGPTPHAGCGTPVTVVRRPVLIGSHTNHCRHARDTEPCVRTASEQLIEIVAVERDGRVHRCSQERRTAMSRGATGAIPTRRHHDGAHWFLAPGDATPPAPSTVATP